MIAVVQVERDMEGLQVALRELFEEAYLREAVAGVMERADEAARARALDDLPERSLSPGYYDRSTYLLDLASAIDCGVTYDAGLLCRDDVRGLQVLKRAKNEFERDHPPCPRCGTRQDNKWVTVCRSCSLTFSRSDN